MSSRPVTGLLLTCCLSFALPANAQDSNSPSERYADAVIAYFAKDYNAADSILTTLIEDGTNDPRVYYFRGLSRYASGNLEAAEIDFEAGARLEYSGLRRVNVPRSLERVQGAVRRVLEEFRRRAKRDAALASLNHQKDKALAKLSADGQRAFLSGKYKLAVQMLEIAANHGSTDPRVFYFRGLAKQKLGLSDEGAADYKRGIGLELHPANRIDVDLALEHVQGEIRRELEVHRHEAISAARLAGDKERQQMIAALIEERAAVAAAGKTTSGAVAKSAIGLPPGTTTPMPATTAPSATVSPATPATPGNTATEAGASAINLAWLPLDAEVIIHVNVRDLWNSPLLAPLHQNADTKMGLQVMQDELNLSPNDIASVAAGVRDATGLAMAGAADPSALATGTDQFVAVVRTRLPFDTQVIQRRTDDYESATHDGKSYYRSIKVGDLPCVYLPDSKTVVLADEEPLKAAMEQGSTAAARPEFDFLDASRHVVIGFVPNDPFALTEQIPTEGSGSDALDGLTTALKDQLLGVGLGVSVTDSVEVEVRALCVDDKAATQVDAAVAALMDEAKGLWALAKSGVPAPIAGVIDSIIRAQKNSATAEVASISTRISGQSIERAIASAEEMLPMLMMGAMSGLGGAMAPGAGATIGEAPAPPDATRPAEGLTVSATARLSSSIELDDDGNQKPKAIELVLDITGQQALVASGSGFPMVSSAKDNNGNDLALRITANFGQGGFEAIDRDDFFVKHPDDGCRVIVAFDPPAESATAIASAEGLVKLRLVENSSQIVVDNAKAQLGKEIDNAELIAAGYQLKLEEKKEKFGDEEYTSWRIEWLNAGNTAGRVSVQEIADGGGLGLQRPELVDADGNVIAAFSGVEYSSFGTNASLAWSMSVDDDQPVPDSARLRFTLNSEVSIVDVPFSAENVPISQEQNGF